MWSTISSTAGYPGGAGLPLSLALLGLAIVARDPNSRLNSRIAAYPYTLLVMISMMLPFIVPQIQDHMKAATLVARGIPIQAHLVRQFATECSKTGCTTGLEYSFVPVGRHHAVSGNTRVGSSSRNPDPA